MLEGVMVYCIPKFAQERFMSAVAYQKEERLFSLDALRGLDMILLTVVGPLVCSAQKSWGCFSGGFMRQFAHGWECFTLWDTIMPLFIFMCGAAVPFALERRLDEGKGVFWRHVLRRGSPSRSSRRPGSSPLCFCGAVRGLQERRLQNER
jgi:hypothetical protein